MRDETLGKIAFILIMFFMFAAIAKADSIDFLCCSYHADRETDYNERNYGLFYKSDKLFIGAYKNSEYHSSFVIGGHKSFYRNEYVELSINYGAVTGYEYYPVLPFVLPEITLFDTVNLYIVPDPTTKELNYALSFTVAKW